MKCKLEKFSVGDWSAIPNEIYLYRLVEMNFLNSFSLNLTNIKLLNGLILKRYFIIFHFPVLNFLLEIKMQMYV